MNTSEKTQKKKNKIQPKRAARYYKCLVRARKQFFKKVWAHSVASNQFLIITCNRFNSFLQLWGVERRKKNERIEKFLKLFCVKA